MGVKFFTLPPKEVPWPFVLINANRPEPGLEYLRLNKGFVREVIIDSGVEIFREPGVRDYPGGARWWIERRLAPLYARVEAAVPGAEVWVTVPDYPDDYHPRSLWIEGKDNVERTLDNILYALERYSDTRWLIPVQGHNSDPASVEEALDRYREAGVPLDGYIAIANLCVEKSGTVLAETVRRAHTWLMAHGLMGTRVHVFGPAVSAVYRVAHMIDSFDSTAWTRPRVPGGWSAKTGRERVWYFITWVHRYADLIDLPYGVPRNG